MDIAENDVTPKSKKVVTDNSSMDQTKKPANSAVNMKEPSMAYNDPATATQRS